MAIRKTKKSNNNKTAKREKQTIAESPALSVIVPETKLLKGGVANIDTNSRIIAINFQMTKIIFDVIGTAKGESGKCRYKLTEQKNPLFEEGEEVPEFVTMQRKVNSTFNGSFVDEVFTYKIVRDSYEPIVRINYGTKKIDIFMQKECAEELECI